MCIITVFTCFALTSCSDPYEEQKQYTPPPHKIHHGQVVQILVQTENKKADSAGENALLGAVAGSLVGAPTLGAIAGASTTNSGHVTGRVKGCKFAVQVEGKIFYFIGSDIGDGSYQDIETCSLLSIGNTLEIIEYINSPCPDLGFHRGDPKSAFRWRNYCLRNAI